MSNFSIHEAVSRATLAGRPDLMAVSAIWVGVGWVVRFESCDYVRTRDPFAQAIGGPSFVSDEGEVVGLGSQEPWQVVLLRLTRTAGNEAKLESWVREQGLALMAAD
jgi:hypothetical protein